MIEDMCALMSPFLEEVSSCYIYFYLQLLDTGFFHADPHPGNMIRTPDGKLAILDFGMSTSSLKIHK
jgi:aarF domain-containing kinase